MNKVFLSAAAKQAKFVAHKLFTLTHIVPKESEPIVNELIAMQAELLSVYGHLVEHYQEMLIEALEAQPDHYPY